jgi:enediyne biosynthesis protein E4
VRLRRGVERLVAPGRLMRNLGQLVALGVVFLSVYAAASAGAPDMPAGPVVFEDIAGRSGVRLVVDPDRTARKHQPETMIAGVALFDYDGDGRLDIYVVNGATMPGLEKKDPRFWNRLYRNGGDGSFEDVTEQAGVAGSGYDMGVATGDYDNDGDSDILVAGLRRNTLFRNDGHGHFSDVTTAAGLAQPDPEFGTLWAVAAAFSDYDRDGWLDLFVSNYCVWDPGTERECMGDQGYEYCHPDAYAGLPNSLYRNNHDGTFADVSAASGIRKHLAKGMGIGVADFDDDGWPDFFVANDTLPAQLFMNRRDGTFAETSVMAGLAVTDYGRPISGMGADARDVDGDGRPDIFETALAHEDFPLFRNLGAGGFEEVTRSRGISVLALPRAGWSNGIYDFDNDGRKDLFVACSGVMDPNGRFRGKVLLPNAIFVQQPDGRFADGSPTAGADFASRQAVHRGAAFGDLDDDGRIDVVVTALEGPVEVWHNVSPARNHWLLVRTIGTRSNRDGMGAKLEIVTASGAQWNAVNTTVGYAGASDRRVHFGLGADARVRELVIRWPSGVVQTLRDVAADQVLTVREPEAVSAPALHGSRPGTER